MAESHTKVLTNNDTGETGGHQAGVTIPKGNKFLIDFFPELDLNEFNPESWIFCTDPDGEIWKMRYVYYNGKTFNPKKSTRNEYRITYMTKFFAKWSASAEDVLVFTATNRKNHYQIKIKKKDTEVLNEISEPGPVVLRGWDRVY
jgi:hypothetical protein